MGFVGTYGAENTKLIPGDIISVVAGTCASAGFSAGVATNVIGIALDEANMGIFNFESIAQGRYRVCVCPKRVWTGASSCPGAVLGGYITVQASLTQIVVNHVSGTHMTIPKGWCEENGVAACKLPRIDLSYERSAPGTLAYLSLVSVDQLCTTPADNPVVNTSTASGVLTSNSERRIVASLTPLHYLEAGFYKVCSKPDTTTNFNWESTGLVIELQDEISTLEVNGLPFVLSVVPQVKGVPIRICRDAQCRVGADSGGSISFISPAESCADAIANPTVTSTGVSGHLSIGTGGLLNQDMVDAILLNAQSGIGFTRRQVCYKRKSSASFVTSGLSLTVQNAVLGLEVNGVRNKGGIRPVIPRSADLELKYFRDASNPPQAGDSFAVLPLTSSCALLCQTSRNEGRCDDDVATDHAPSGFLSAHSNNAEIRSVSCLIPASNTYNVENRQPADINCDASISKAPDFSGLIPGRYQLCYRAPSKCSHYSCFPSWHATGISVRVQHDVISLVLQPKTAASGPIMYVPMMRGLQITTVQNDWQTISFSAFPGSTHAVTFQFIPFDADCNALNDDNISTVRPTVGPVTSGKLCDRVQFTNAIRSAKIGLNNVCIRIGVGPYSSSGLSLRLQDKVRSLVVNGVRPNRGLLVPIPAVGASKITYDSDVHPKIGDSLAFIPPENVCSDPVQNPKSLSSSIAYPKSGHVDFVSRTLAVGTEILLDPSAVNMMMKLLPLQQYKVCFRPAHVESSATDTAFVDTGLGIVLHSELLSLQVNVVGDYIVTESGNNPGLRTSLPIATGNKVQLPRNGTISFIAADGDCMDGVENPVFSPDQTMLHIETYGKDNTLLSTTLDGVVGIRGAKGPGTYQVCFKPPALGSNFMGTGLAVTLQNMFVSLIVNEASPNRGKPADAADTVGH